MPNVSKARGFLQAKRDKTKSQKTKDSESLDSVIEKEIQNIL